MTAPPDIPRTRFRVGGVDVLPDRGLLKHAGRELHVQPRVMDVLCLLASQPGEVWSRETLIDEIWTVRYGADESLTRAVSRLRHALRELGEANCVETVPKRGYRLTAPVLPLAAGGPGRANTRAPGNDNRERSPPARAPAPRHARGAVLIAAGAVAASALGVAALWTNLAGTDRADAVDARVTVVDRIELGTVLTQGGGASLAAAAERLESELSTSLAAATMDFVREARRNADGPAPEFELHALIEREGGGDAARIEFVDQASGAVLWTLSAEFARETDRSTLPPLAAKVAEIVSCGLEFRRAHGEPPLETLRWYLRFCEAGYDQDSLVALNAFTRRILETDPDNPQARALHAVMLASNARYQMDSTADRAASLSNARSLAQSALDSDPDSGLARLAIAYTHAPSRYRIEVDRILNDVFSRGWPPPVYVSAYATLLREVGRLDEARRLLAQASAVKPSLTFSRALLALMLAMNGDLASARAEFAEAAMANPNSGATAWYQIVAELFYGDPDRALAALSAGPPGDGATPPASQLDCFTAAALHRNGVEADHEVVAAACVGTQLDYRARILASVGAIDEAYAVVDAMADRESPQVTLMFFYPEMREFRHDPRFWPLAHRFGLVDYWLETDRWPDFCAEPDLPFDCETAARAVADGAPPRNAGL